MKYNLSEITQLIKDRRTIYPKDFSDRKVFKEQIEVLLNNAIWAPSHKLTQPWRFKVFMENGKNHLAEFMSDLYLKLTPLEKQNPEKLAKIKMRIKKSSAVIVICMKRDEEERLPEIEEVESVACAVQNMLLTCTAYGLAGFWSTPKIVYSEEIKDFLDLKTKDKCLGLFYLGYPGENWPRSRRKPIEYVTDWVDS